MDKKVCVYAGTGAVLAKDVEVALEKSDLVYEEIDEASIKKGELKDYSVLIVPGGYTKRCVTALGKKGFERIRDFVESGGGYIGICAGAYMASKTVEVQGHPSGLNIIDVQNKRKAGRRIVSITIIEPEHPLVSGCKKELRIWYQNGPKILAGKDVEKIAVYDKNSAAIVCGKKGKGKIILFSPHPEGNLAIRVNTPVLGNCQAYKEQIPDWNFPITENPGSGEYRYLMFAWKTVDAIGIMIQFADNGAWGANPAPCVEPPDSHGTRRYVDGENETGWGAICINEEPPSEWRVYTRDLVEDFGEFVMTGMALTPFGTDHALYDFIYLAADEDEFPSQADVSPKEKIALTWAQIKN